MKTITIEGKELKIFEGGSDGKIAVEFDSQEFNLDNFFFRNNGLKKGVQVDRIILDLGQNKIFTEKKTQSITPTGDKVDTIKNPTFETKEADVSLFMAQITPLLVPAAINGILIEMGFESIYDVTTGQLKTNINVLE